MSALTRCMRIKACRSSVRTFDHPGWTLRPWPHDEPGEGTTLGRLFDIVEEYRARYAPHEPTYSRVAEEIGVARQTLLNWRAPTKLLDKRHLRAIAEVTGVPYARVLDALLEDIGYLRADDGPASLSERRSKVAGDDLAGLPSVAHKPRAKGRNQDD